MGDSSKNDIDMRDAFFNSLYEIIEADKNVMVLTADHGAFGLNKIKEDFPEQYLNMGIAEQNMASVAAGLALEGWRPVAYSIAAFATGRPYEQIRFCLSYHNLPVVLVGAGRGLTYATCGVSHFALDDIALMSQLPDMTVVIPGDPNEVLALFPQIVDLPGPKYFTVGRFGEPIYQAEDRPVLGKARLVRDGSDIALITTGEVVIEALNAQKMLLDKGIRPIIYQMHTVKPLDTDILNSLVDKVHTLIVVDEHLPRGGLWGEIVDWYSRQPKSPKLLRIGPKDQWPLGNFKREDFRQQMGYDAISIAQVCCQVVVDKAKG